jgi:hypothetical protein
LQRLRTGRKVDVRRSTRKNPWVGMCMEIKIGDITKLDDGYYVVTDIFDENKYKINKIGRIP